MQLSSYHDDDSLNTLFNIKADSFSILSLNCQSLNAKFDQINIKVQQLRSEGHEFKVICLQETWLSDDSETALFQIQGYNLVQHGKQCSAHGGLAIYISTKLNFSTVDININSEVWEGQFIEILNIETNKTLIIGNLYRPPHNTNDLYQTFINEFIPILEHLQRVNQEVIIAGDFNIDLLKINENATLGDYFNSLVAQSLFPQITLPTRFSDRNCTIIDNFLCKLTHNFKPSTTGILMSIISDHLPYFIFLDFITAKHILNRNQTNAQFPEAFLIGNVLVSDPTTIANKFNTFFAEIGSKLTENMADAENDKFRDYLLNPTIHNFTFQLISEENTMLVLNHLKSKPSCGYDGISTKLLKVCKHQICKLLTLIINQMLSNGIFPDDLKIAKVIPLFKKGDQSLLNNYRSISLLPSISKILERIIFNQIHTYFSTNDLYYSGQYGFREKHSTQMAALELIDRITQDIDAGSVPIAIFIDLSKAFDTLDHNILISKLQYYGINGVALRLMRSYLSNRKQFVQFGTYSSNSTDILMGVPQGSILGPLLFIIYINDMARSSDIFKFLSFADDTTLITKLRINNSLNDELNNFHNWLKSNKLSLNVNKTKAIAFHMHQKVIQLPLLQIAGSVI